PKDVQTERDPRRLRWIYGAVGTTVLVLVSLVFVNVLISRTISAEPEGPLKLEVVGHMWWWAIVYAGEPANRTTRTANELHLPAGRTVEITLHSRDVIHSFWVPNLHGKQDMIPGRTNKLVLRADDPGVYRGQCAEFCGLQHANMAFY